jgi:23S rRNA pseudouridine1911/1915/1917 synthase
MKYTLKHTATLLEAVMEVYKGISKQNAKQKISYSEILVNGEKVNRHPQKIIEGGSVIEFVPLQNKAVFPKKPDRKNPVVLYYEDNFLIAALKPAGIISCESNDEAVDKSYHKLLEKFLSERDGVKVRLWVIHRLDREVEGFILFGKSRKIQKIVKDNWPLTTKHYLALTEKKPNPPQGIIENWLADTPMQKVVAFDHEVPGSKFAKTGYAFLRKEKKYFLLEINLFTGRKNQIRVHLSGIGCPIVGDRRYGADDSVKRQIRLAAYFLEFPHPIDSKKILLKYEPSPDFFNPSEGRDEKYRII